MMEITLFAKKHQTHCYECGRKFTLDSLPNAQGICSTTCPEGCRGSWAAVSATALGCREDETVEVSFPLPDLPLPWEVVPDFCLACYKLGINPLPPIREVLPDGIEVRYFILDRGTSYTSDGPCVAVWVGYDDFPWLERGEDPRPEVCRIDLQTGGHILWSAESGAAHPII